MAEKQLGARSWGATDTLDFGHGAEVYGPSWMPSGYVPGNYYMNTVRVPNANGTALGRNTILTFPLTLTATVTVDRLWVEITAPNTVDPAAFYRPVIAEHDAATSKPKPVLVAQGGRISMGTGNGGDTTYAGPGCYEAAVGPVTLQPGNYWIGGVIRSSSVTQSGSMRGNPGNYSTFPMLVTNAANPGNTFVSSYYANTASDPIGSLNWIQTLAFAWPVVGYRVAP